VQNSQLFAIFSSTLEAFLTFLNNYVSLLNQQLKLNSVADLNINISEVYFFRQNIKLWLTTLKSVGQNIAGRAGGELAPEQVNGSATQTCAGIQIGSLFMPEGVFPRWSIYDSPAN